MLTKMRIRTPDKPYRIQQDSLSEFDNEGGYIATAKYDGYRAILDYAGGSRIGLFSRRGNSEGGPRTHPIEESLRNQLIQFVNDNRLNANTRIDGEWLKFRTKGEPFYVVFGILYADGKWLGKEPESVRWEIVKNWNYDQPNIMLAEYAEENYANFFQKLKNRDYTKSENDWKLEGIVLKHATSTLVGRPQKSDKNPLWFKAKWRDGSSGKVATYENLLLLGVGTVRNGPYPPHLKEIPMTANIQIVGMRTRVTNTEALVINTCSNSNSSWQRDLSPFIIGPCELYDNHVSLNMENGWQYTKLYAEHADGNGEPTGKYWEWAKEGFENPRAVRYPMGRGARPLHAWWDGEKLPYIEARKKIYGPLYAEAVQKTEGWKHLVQLYQDGGDLIFRDFDGHDHDKLGLSLTEVLNNPRRKMGHSFVLKMLLTDDPALKQMELR